jgi:hypothetical protein
MFRCRDVDADNTGFGGGPDTSGVDTGTSGRVVGANSPGGNPEEGGDDTPPPDGGAGIGAIPPGPADCGASTFGND